ncbi:hypothetical protein CVT25_008784 [Psilocybe cyanescens]|uniref:Uncharacterized protein n=1 Tax=Psilocybe cyanescens TaxID=93625 RepID=A0A409XMZ2_PSICY|nr:hypothetical protein CVT25_008784 [Psilocybe cyanescens]
MADLQSLTRSLLAAGHAESKDGKEKYLLHVNNEARSYLQCLQWSGDSLTKQTLIVDDVRPKSTAAYLITPKARLVICISPSSALSAYMYDSEDREWVELDEWDEESSVVPLPAHVVHPDGRLAGTVDASGRMHLVFQDQTGRLVRLVYLMNSWFSTILTASPAVGSPLAVAAVGDTLHVFYVAAVDGFVHDVAGTNGDWNDRVVARYVVEKGVNSLVMRAGDGSGEKELYVMTNEDRVLKIGVDSGRVMKLGIVKTGKFVSERSVDHCVMDAWKGTLTADKLKTYLSDDPSCIETPDGDHSVTPLAAACIRGHVHIVRLLLQNKANPNALSSKKRTPLFHATSSTSLEGSDRLAIVRSLLEAGANVDECYAESGFSTPLMNAISLIADQNIVDELLKHGASPNTKDVAGHSAETLAKGTPMEGTVAERAEQANSTPFERQLVELLVALMMFIVAYTNSKRVKNVVEQIIVKLTEMKEAENESKCFNPFDRLNDADFQILRPTAESVSVGNAPVGSTALVSRR